MQKKINEAGYTLVAVVLLFAVLTILGVTLVTLSLASIKTSTTERNSQSAFYIAEAGLNYLENRINSEVVQLYKSDQVKTEADFFQKVTQLPVLSLTDERYEQFEIVNGVEPYAILHVRKVEGTTNQYEMISQGFLESESRTVSKTLTINWKEKYEEVVGEYDLPPFTVFTSGQFLMRNGKIIGDIATVNTAHGAIIFQGGGPTHQGDIYVPGGNATIVDNRAAGHIKSEIKEISQAYMIPELPDFPTIPDYKCPEDETVVYHSHSYDVMKDCKLRIDNWIVRDSKYKLVMEENIKLKEMILHPDVNHPFYIDLNGKDRAIVVEHLKVTNGETIIIGDGSLTVFVTDRITFQSGAEFGNSNHPSKLNIFYDGTRDVKLAGNQKLYGSIFTKSASIELTGSAAIYGNIFSGGNNLKMAGGSDAYAQLILAPNAEVTITGGGTLFGRVISKNFTITGGGEVIFDEPFIIHGSISLEAIGKKAADDSDGSTGGIELIETGESPSFSTSSLREVND